jgi:hypothetical protein
MLFKKDKSTKCDNCNSRVEKKHNFCPYCGHNLMPENSRTYGFLGRTDSPQEKTEMPSQGFGITDKMLNSMINSLMKNLEKQFNSLEKDPDFLNPIEPNTKIKRLPNGISIKMTPLNNPSTKKNKEDNFNKTLNENQIKKMSELPRKQAKSNVKRLNNKIIYELSTPGITSTEDIFISKLESGYEIKAIGSKNLYVNNLPLNLPLKRLSLLKNKLLVEFRTEE